MHIKFFQSFFYKKQTKHKNTVRSRNYVANHGFPIGESVSQLEMSVSFCDVAS